MKNTLIAAAVAAVFAAPAAFADTTLYGQGHVSMDIISGDNAGVDEDSTVSMSNNSSRIGVKGSHAVTDSLSAVYQFEWSAGLTGEGDLGQRNRYIGLKGGFGTVVFGRHDTPFKVLGNKVGMDWGSTQLGGARNIRSIKDGGAGFDLRVNNVLGYLNSFGPVDVFAAYSFDHEQGSTTTVIGGDNNNDTATSIMVSLGKGKPYFVGLGYEIHNVDGLGTEEESAMRAAASYQLGAVKVHGFYQQTTDAGFTDGSDRTSYGVGASLKMGKNTLKAQHYIADDNDLVDESGSTMTMVGIDRKLSKMTAVYAQYAMMSFDDNATFGFGGQRGGESYTAEAGGDISGLSLGLQVKF